MSNLTKLCCFTKCLLQLCPHLRHFDWQAVRWCWIVPTHIMETTVLSKPAIVREILSHVFFSMIGVNEYAIERRQSAHRVHDMRRRRIADKQIYFMSTSLKLFATFSQRHFRIRASPMSVWQIDRNEPGLRRHYAGDIP